MTPDPYHDTAPADPDEARRRLLRALLAQESAPPAESAESAADRTGVLSAAQYRMWFHQHARPDSAAYNLAVAARLDGPLSAEALRTAFAGVVERHEILRTVYRTGPDGLPSQHVLPAAEPVIDIEDVAYAGDAVRRAAEAAALPFDLAAQTPLRLRLYRTGPDRHLLLVVLHHIACDDLSWDPLFGDVSAGYRNATCTPAIPPAPLPLQYGEHAARERPAPEADLAYWRERLTPAPPPAAPLPDLPRPATAGEAGARWRTRSRRVSTSGSRRSPAPPR
ncbi:condensation domain-containing protein [Streptomyces sp. ST1015]|uniref:condensation domain-containing protein n=1 Tax=Streptomyces sp. ST1015 TaxID=1848900 RepID=UPI001CA71F3C|nr:condensation domain-containing protein [Streptomyces sp. ST1015]QZZ31445.1 hypothetical protein A7X85_39185 [Streptomyces sp. ST1015]